MNTADSRLNTFGVQTRRGLAMAMIAVGAVLSACGAEQAPVAAEQAQPVKVLVMRSDDVPVVGQYPGRLEGSKEVQVRARVEGILLRRTYTEGQQVEAGQLLFEIDSAPFEVALNRAKAQLAQARASLSAAERRWRRASELIKTNAISQRDRDDAESELDEARATLQLAEAEVSAAQINLDYCKVRAPISGITSREQVSEGSLVGPSANSLLTSITQLDPLWVNISMPDEMVLLLRRLLKEGELSYDESQRAVQIETAGEQTHPHLGHINFSDSVIDRNTGTVQFRATVDNPEGSLLPGQFVRVSLKGLYSRNSMVLPERAVLQNAQGSYVYVVNAEQRAEVRPVTLGLEVEGGRIVDSGLEPGDTVVLEGLVRVRPGALLEPEVIEITYDYGPEPHFDDEPEAPQMKLVQADLPTAQERVQ
ncbi:efflux RND transporter periplasmic adaptor subunit [Spongiibacter tropicus]|uniref:efflux RND transporter periplasmic adaptor subunit n=1 Tax=Spongiibacter tropicus TaxID=454602 RepID=UPI002353B1CD|nr:efflux RND transporter periplasmic adaptor subunit [Spongiibacter tropicus]|tara:strand:- start:4487 stop:5752 length:1266 start_codon:yes stop_codon:yes gene_type:complete